ncbi:MAG: NAD-dependent epimerase/dehydratase family protein [Candidatus Nanohaloarchaea archaeon]|nr:NAD-dependent epimerase/dehydratase family protein [Candidatus Nanohaloarchaea archaeon]
MAQNILVAGANGFVGSNLIPYLAEQGHNLTALDLQPYDGPATSVAGDLTDYKSFEAALDGIDTAFYLVHSMGTSDDFTATERQCAENFVRACDDHDVDRIVFIGGIVHQDHVSEHLVSRTTVGDILRTADADVTEFRAAIILGWESSSFQIMYQLVKRLPIMIAPRWLDSRCQPIHIDDVLHYLGEAITIDETRGAIYEIGGSSIHTYRQLLSILGEEMGRKPFIRTVPLLTPRLSSLWVELFTDYPTGLIRALVESLRTDMVVEDDTIDDVIPHEPKGYRSAVQQILQDQD